MPVYEFEAIDATGHGARGVVHADTARDARAQLRNRSLATLQVREAAGAEGSRAQVRLGARDRTAFTRQLSALVLAGLPLAEALAACAEGAGPGNRTMAMALRGRVMEGAPFAAALAAFPATFDPVYRSSVAAGERSGGLARVLELLAANLEAREASRRRIIAALAYPALLLAVALLVVGGLMLYVVPEVAGVFVRNGQTLPWPTRLLLGASALLRAHMSWAGPTTLAAAAALAATWRRPDFRRWRDARLLAVPAIGRVAVAMECARFARTLAMLCAGSVRLLDAMGLAAGTVSNTSIRAALHAAALDVREGVPLARALRARTPFPAAALHMVANGERVGKVEAMLERVAVQLEAELDARASLAMSVLGPLVILLVGGLVLFIVLAVLLPIFEMNQLVQ